MGRGRMIWAGGRRVIAQFRQEMAARLDEKNQLIKRYDEEIQRLRASANSRSSAETSSLRDQCANHAKERAALKTILESKIRTLVDGIGRSVQELPEAQQHPRLTREVQALDKLVNATVNAMRTTSTPSSTSEASQ
ncbi:hypothetical protein CYMTET_53285 [Cymbomonas tetramitiformis]|uniref:Uncharacterized protein n=1 Tax=Cymbomonas tetramitiformis TaxID=36881 RepID=A0AAE0BJ12_9CHLO|nr:hypothetical protein CYMTET_53285 [Cymbomonas tetramitiformis]